MNRKLTVMITGAEGALGATVTQKFASSENRVIATYLKQPLASWKPSRDFIPLRMDVADPESVRESLESVSQHPIEAWIHCAGGFRYTTVEQYKDEDLDFLINVNLKSAFIVARALLPGMRKRDFGRIVLVSSRSTLVPGAGMGPYTATKAGINMLTQALAEEVKSQNITVNAVLPTIIDTPINRKDMPGADFKTWVSRESLAEIVYSLTQPFGDPIHGALIPVAGRI